MKSEIKKLDNSIVEITIEDTKENIIKHRKKVIEKIRKNADIKWFRPWANIPEEIILKNYNEEQINSMIIDESLNYNYSKALKEHKILPISQWELTEIVSQDPLIIKLQIEIFPEVEVWKEYKKIKIKKTKVEVLKDEVDDNLNQIKQKFTKFNKAWKEYEAKMWDKVNINTNWYDKDWNKLENTNMKDYPLLLWWKILVPWFEEQLVWVKTWDKKSIDIVFPKDYHNEDFKWKETKFDVEVNFIEEAIIPEFTPEFIKNLRWKDLDFEWFKKLIEDEIRETKENNARLEDEHKLIDELLKISKVPFWPTLLKNQIDRVFEEIKQNITNSWAKVDDYIASLGMSKDDYIEKQIKPIAKKRLESELILNKLKEIEKIEVTNEEIDEEIKKIMSRFSAKDVLEKLKDLYKPWTKYYEELKHRIWYRKLIDSFFE